MGVLSRWRRRRSPYRAVSDEEQMSRYVYLLGSLPTSVIEKAHAQAFKDLPREKRRELFEELRPFLADGEQAENDDNDLLARLVRRAEERRAGRTIDADGAAASGGGSAALDPRDGVDPRALMMSAGVMTVVAHHVLLSTALTTYFTVGAGALLADQPAWVGDITGVEAGAAGGSFDGAGFDGGFGGFDAGGLGGFDAGGGFG